MAITAQDVMTLRQRTGMGMMECKAALNETGGDLSAAVEVLRKAAKGKMDERTDRAAAEGVIAVAKAEGSAALIELNTETDFVARNDAFIKSAEHIAQEVLKGPVGEAAPSAAITKIIDEIRITTKENASYARGVKVQGGQIGSYVHHNGKVAGLVVIDGGKLDAETLTGLAQQVAACDGSMMPIPLAIDETGLAADAITAKKNEYIEEAKATGKPAEIAEKMSTGKLRKWIGDNTLVGQAYVKDMTGKTTVTQVLKGAKITRYIRYQVGVK